MLGKLQQTLKRVTTGIDSHTKNMTTTLRSKAAARGLAHPKKGKKIKLKRTAEIKTATAKLQQAGIKKTPKKQPQKKQTQKKQQQAKQTTQTTQTKSKQTKLSKTKVKSKKTKLATQSTHPAGADSIDYFVEARSWADDLYVGAIISRNRYKTAFFTAIGLCVLLTIAINGLVPMQHLEPLLINHYQDGRVDVQPIRQPYAPTNQAQVESELVRYVLNRESYDPSSYNEQYSLINLMSNNVIANQYMQSQSTHNKHSPINILGNTGYRSVHIDSVVFLDSVLMNKGKIKSKQTHHNLAQINFTITDHFKHSAHTKTTPLTALIAWQYQGTPSDPSDMWRDWNGFTVTRYSVERRNV